MKVRYALGLALAASLSVPAAFGQSAASIEGRARAESRAVQQIRSTLASGAQPLSAATGTACAVPDALPAGPGPDAEAVQISGAWGQDDRFDATLWREACPSDVNLSILYFRAVQAAGTSFICGSAIQVVQDGLTYDVRLVRTAARIAFCDNLAGPTTFVLDQYPDSPKFDGNLALDLTFKGAFGNSYSVLLPAYNLGANPITPAVGLWWNPAESGTGYALDVKHGVLVVTVYSYTASGLPIWYLASGPIVNNVASMTLDKYLNGQCASCLYRAPAINGNDGPMTITFSSPASARMTLPGGRAVSIVPQPF
jgi:hypothetical protein